MPITANIQVGDGGQPTGAVAMLRRALVRCGQEDAALHGQAECAELLRAAGFPDAARLLYETTFLRGGFSAAGLRAQAGIAARTGLWAPATWPSRAADAEAPSFSIDRAVYDLRRLLAMPLDLAPLAPVTDDALAPLALPLRPPAIEVSTEIDVAAIAGLSQALCAALRGDDDGALAAMLQDVRTLVLERPSFILGDHFFTASVPELAAMVASNAMRTFFLAHHDLCWSPFGSPALLLAAARLDEGGLAPYFANIPRLIRGPRDILGLLQLAGGGTDAGQAAMLERWCVLLAIHLDEHHRIGLADDAGDLGLMGALRGLLVSAVRHPRRNHQLYWVIRDAALDNGDMALAIDAQKIIARLRLGSATELIVIAEMFATAGATAAADAALCEALRIAPDDEGALERLTALRENRFQDYRVEFGFGSSRRRSAIRMRNRAERDAERSEAEAVPG